jgi:hypothetical protein
MFLWRLNFVLLAVYILFVCLFSLPWVLFCSRSRPTKLCYLPTPTPSPPPPQLQMAPLEFCLTQHNFHIWLSISPLCYGYVAKNLPRYYNVPYAFGKMYHGDLHTKALYLRQVNGIQSIPYSTSYVCWQFHFWIIDKYFHDVNWR